MKKSFVLVIFISVFSILNAQPYTVNWVGGTVGSWTTSTNWENEYGNPGLPNQGDIVIFGSGVSILLTEVPSNTSATAYAEIRVINSTDLTFQSASMSNVYVDHLLVDAGCVLKVDQDLLSISFNVVSANIYGTVSFNETTTGSAVHKLKSDNPGTVSIRFYDGSTFIAGSGLTGSPFGETILNEGTVEFQDGSSYEHYGGGSPFGLTDISVAGFFPESNYLIKGGDGSNIFFSGKNYGNIIVDAGNEIVVPPSLFIPSTFSFNTITALSGGLTFNGSPSDEISIGPLIESSGGSLDLNSGRGFYFSGLFSTIKGDFPITLENTGTGSFQILPVGGALYLETSLNMNCGGTGSVLGVVECNENSIQIGNGLLSLEGATIITQHPLGITGALEGSFTYNTGVTFTFFENLSNPHSQVTGLVGHNSIIDIINVSNPHGVEMDNDISVNILNLNSGSFDIGDHTLVINGNIFPASGTLVGDQSVSVLKINTVSADVVSIPTPLELNELYIVEGSAALIGAEELNVNSFFQSMGNFSLNEATMIVHVTFDVSGGMFNGSMNAGLMFETGVAEIHFLASGTTLEFRRLINHSAIPFAMPIGMTIYELLDIGTSNFIFAGYHLGLNGSCQSSGGVFEATGMSSLTIGGTDEDMGLTFSTTFDTLAYLYLDRFGSVIDIFSDLVISSNLTLYNGKLRLNNTKLYIPIGSQPMGSDTYIITGINGNVVSEMPGAATNCIFPVGTESYYAPVSILADEGIFFVAVCDTVYTEGIAGNTVTDTRIINHTWKIVNSDLSIPYNLSLVWNANAQGVDFDQNYVKLYNIAALGDAWTEVIGLNATAATAGSYTVEQINANGLFMVSSAINQAPVVTSPQEFTIDEHSPAGTVVGQLAVEETDPGQTLSITLLSGPDPNPFTMDNTLSIIVRDPLLLNYAETPVFNYKLNVCDNGIPSLCKPVDVAIYLNDINEELLIANYFSPNNDNINDTWIIQGARLVPTDVKVFNNLGALVYQSSEYQNDWNGISNGQRLPPGVYIYIVRTLNSEFKGTLTLAR